MKTIKLVNGVKIDLSGDEITTAIDAYLIAHTVYVKGARTIRVNGSLIENGSIYIDPSGYVIDNGVKFAP